MADYTKIFDIESPAEFFAMLNERFTQYRSAEEKDTEDAISIILMSTHLREWIAPGYNLRNGKWPTAANPAQRFSRMVYDHPKFEIIRSVANGTKHLRGAKTIGTGVAYQEGTQGSVILGSVAGKTFLKGIASAHFIDGCLLEDVLDPIIELYSKWFSSKKPA